MNNKSKELLKNIPNKEEFYKYKMNIKQADNYIWTENFAKKELVRLGCKYIKNIDNKTQKKKLKENIKTPDFIIGTKPSKIYLNNNINNYFYVDIKEITGAMYANFGDKNKILSPNPVEELLKNSSKAKENEIKRILITEKDEDIIEKLLNQLKRIENKYGKYRNSKKNGIIYVESPDVNEATFVHILKLINTIFLKIKIYLKNEILFKIENEILSSQKNELITISIPFKLIFNITHLSFIAIFGSKRFKGLNLFFINSDIADKYKYDNDFKWLIKLINKQNYRSDKNSML